MHTRTKALTVTAAMVLTFAVLPTLGAAAAEPLPDGSYELALGDATYTLEVVEGVPVVDDVEGVSFQFAFDDDGRVLDEFEVAVGDAAFEVEVGEDGTVSVDGASDEGDAELLEREELDVEEPAADEQEESDEPVEDAVDEDDEAGADDASHGELVSSVAHCAPSGKVAREAGLPNHGAFVSAAAKGEVLEFEVDGVTHTADLSTPQGAAAFCALAEELIAAGDQSEAQEPETEELDAEESKGDDDGAEADAPRDKGNGNGNGNGDGKGREHAPGQQKKND